HNAAPYYFLPLVILFPLALLLRMLRLAGWMVVLAVIGILWFAPLFLPKTLPALPENYLTLITFNVFPDNKHPKEIERWLLVKNADVVMLQETGGRAVLDAMSSLQERYPYKVTQDAKNGAAIFSRYPIIDSSEFMLADTSHQRVVIDFNGKHLTLYNVHLW